MLNYKLLSEWQAIWRFHENDCDVKRKKSRRSFFDCTDFESSEMSMKWMDKYWMFCVSSLNSTLSIIVCSMFNIVKSSDWGNSNACILICETSDGHWSSARIIKIDILLKLWIVAIMLLHFNKYKIYEI